MHAENDEEKIVSTENEDFIYRLEMLDKEKLNVLRHRWVPVPPAGSTNDVARLFARCDFAMHPDGRRAVRMGGVENTSALWFIQREPRSERDAYAYEWTSDLGMAGRGFVPLQSSPRSDLPNGEEPTPHVPVSEPPAPWATNTTTEASAAVYALATPSMEVTVGGPLRSRYPADPLPDEGPLKAIVDALGLDWEKFESIEISRTFGITLREDAEHPNPSEVPEGARGVRETQWTLPDPDTGTVSVTSTWTIEEER